MHKVWISHHQYDKIAHNLLKISKAKIGCLDLYFGIFLKMHFTTDLFIFLDLHFIYGQLETYIRSLPRHNGHFPSMLHAKVNRLNNQFLYLLPALSHIVCSHNNCGQVGLMILDLHLQLIGPGTRNHVTPKKVRENIFLGNTEDLQVQAQEYLENQQYLPLWFL